MGKPEFKSTRRTPLVMTRGALTRSKAAPIVSSANIKVVVRVRPLNERENESNYRVVVKFVDEQILVFDPKVNPQAFFYHGVEQKGRDIMRKSNKDLQFMFDRVFGFDATNEELFQNTTKSLITSLMDGYNCSVFAYGATGAGKTHTMIGNIENRGITYLTMAELFKTKEELSQERTFELGITYLEVYNELVQDLLNPGGPLQLRDDGKHGVYVAGIKVHKIKDAEELFSLLAQGNKNRTQHPTDANAESSRSHAVFQVYVQMNILATHEIRTAKLSMIDLAGSERGSVTGFGGARFAEGANINKSLLALGNCINSLADGQKYVPYRDSKLTRLLKDSLGGNCQTVMIANVSPSSASYEDTYNTLKYAARAKKIKSNMKRNIVNVELHSGEYVKIVEDLKKELDRLKREIERLKTQPADPSKREPEDALLQQLKEKAEKKALLLERKHSIQCAEHIFSMRRQFKEDADRRLSGLTPTPDRDTAHSRLGNVIERMQRQEENLRLEYSAVLEEIKELDKCWTDFVKLHPELNLLAELESVKLGRIEDQYQIELRDRENALLKNELRYRENLHQRTFDLMRPCYMQLNGHGFATDALIAQYRALVNELQDKKGINFDGTDSGLGSSSVSSSETEIRQNAGTKRRLPDNDDHAEVKEGDRTFVMESDDGQVRVNDGKSNRNIGRSEEMLRKVHSTPDGAKKKVVVSLKENKRIVPAKRAPLGMRKVASKTDLTKRQPFRT